jgi:hypothetical protein
MLRCALQTALGQDFASIEVLVMGDACTDESAAIACGTGDARVRWINRTTRCGSQWGPNNDGIGQARGEYIAFLGHDDLWFPWHLRHLLSVVDRGRADLGHALVALLTPSGLLGVNAAPAKGERYATTFAPPSGWLVRRQVLVDLGGFRDQATLSRGTDYDLLRRIEHAGYRIGLSARLGVLKFPSSYWRAYALSGAVPQEEWADAIRQGASDVERRVLTGAVCVLSTATPRATPIRALGLAMRAGARWLRDGTHDVFDPLWRFQFRRERRATSRLRGLS